MPGYFGAWAKRFRWKEYAIAWDAYFNDIVATCKDEQMATARRETGDIMKRTGRAHATSRITSSGGPSASHLFSPWGTPPRV